MKDYKKLYTTILMFLLLLVSGYCFDNSRIALIYKGKFFHKDKIIHKWGKAELDGASIALNEFKKKFPKSNLNIEIFEYSNNPMSVIDAVKLATNQGIKMFAGIAWSNNVYEAKSYIKQMKCNLISSMASSSELEKDMRIISTFPSNKILLDSLYNYLKKINIQCKRFSVIYAEVKPESLIYSFSNGESLLDKLLELKGCNTVLTDQNMGDGITGLELVNKIREQNIPCKIYMISNEPSTIFEEVAKDAGADGYLEAPINEESLREILS